MSHEADSSTGGGVMLPDISTAEYLQADTSDVVTINDKTSSPSSGMLLQWIHKVT